MSDHNHNGGAILGAFLLGGLVGAAVALLTAPKPGKETREDVYRWTEGAALKTRDAAQRIAAEGGEKARAWATAAGDKVRDVTADASEAIKGRVSELKEKVGRKDEAPDEA